MPKKSCAFYSCNFFKTFQMSEDVIDTIGDVGIKTEPLEEDDQGVLEDPLSMVESTLKVEPDLDSFDDVSCQIKIKVSETEIDEKEYSNQSMTTQSICKVETISDIELEDNTCDTIKADETMDSPIHKNKRPIKKRERRKKDTLTRYKCNQCEKDYVRKGALMDHVQVVHEGIPFKCNQCSKTYNSRHGLHDHLQSVHKGVPFKCDQCSKTYTSGVGLHDHIQSVHKGVTYNCGQCAKEFATSYTLKLHVQSAHEGVTYHCDLCSKTCPTKATLYNHINRIHKAKSDTNDK